METIIWGKQNFLYLPYGYDASDTTGYNQYLWEEPLQLEGKCNFKLDYIKLDQDVVVSVKDTDGTIIDDEISPKEILSWYTTIIINEIIIYIITEINKLL